jgi:hypothetical protein
VRDPVMAGRYRVMITTCEAARWIERLPANAGVAVDESTRLHRTRGG